jgi:hypothetical protein
MQILFFHLAVAAAAPPATENVAELALVYQAICSTWQMISP